MLWVLTGWLYGNFQPFAIVALCFSPVLQSMMWNKIVNVLKNFQPFVLSWQYHVYLYDDIIQTGLKCLSCDHHTVFTAHVCFQEFYTKKCWHDISIQQLHPGLNLLFNYLRFIIALYYFILSCRKWNQNATRNAQNLAKSDCLPYNCIYLVFIHIGRCFHEYPMSRISEFSPSPNTN